LPITHTCNIGTHFVHESWNLQKHMRKQHSTRLGGLDPSRPFFRWVSLLFRVLGFGPVSCLL
jgi:hypothetical protein